MRTFGGFLHRSGHVYGEVRGDRSAPSRAPFLAWPGIHGRNPFVRRAADRSAGCAEQSDRGRLELLRTHQGNAADRDRFAPHLVQGAELAPSPRRDHPDRLSRAQDGFRNRARGGDRRPGEECRRSSARSITFSVIRSRKTSAIAICRNRKDNLGAANPSTPTRRWGRLFTPKLTRAIWKFHWNKTASEATGPHQPDDLSGGGDHRFRQPIAHPVAG